MKLHTAIQVALLMCGFSQIQAQNVKSYQAHKDDVESTDAIFNKLYIRGLGEGMERTNVSMFLHVFSTLHLCRRA
jgi:hypothetical protein